VDAVGEKWRGVLAARAGTTYAISTQVLRSSAALLNLVYGSTSSPHRVTNAITGAEGEARAISAQLGSLDDTVLTLKDGDGAVVDENDDDPNDENYGTHRVISDCHFAVQLNHFIPGFLSYSVAVFPK
jgi:hypothetical protein